MRNVILNLSTLQHSRCYPVRLVGHSPYSAVIEALQDIPLTIECLLKAGEQAWVPRRNISAEPIVDGAELLVLPDNVLPLRLHKGNTSTEAL